MADITNDELAELIKERSITYVFVDGDELVTEQYVDEILVDRISIDKDLIQSVSEK